MASPSPLQWSLRTSVGRLYVVASARGLRGVDRRKRPVPMAASLGGDSPEARVLADAVRQLERYFTGKLKTFTVPLDVDGTPFQKEVWRALARIPYGRTCSYRDVAARIGRPRSVRAVGNANGKNPICVVVPCHRVVGADGSIGGYSGGLAMKRRLLRLERPGKAFLTKN